MIVFKTIVIIKYLPYNNLNIVLNGGRSVMENLQNSLTTKEKIIKVTMDIIGEEGFQSITIRKIAARAQVNIAAVNYHFGSKDAVIDEALKTVTTQLKSTYSILKDTDIDITTRLEKFLYNYTEVLFKYPDILKNMIDHAIHNSTFKEQADYAIFLKTEGVNLLKTAIGQIHPGESNEFLYVKTMHMVSALSWPILMGENTKEIMGIDLTDPELRRLHVKLLLKQVCKPE